MVKETLDCISCIASDIVRTRPWNERTITLNAGPRIIVALTWHCSLPDLSLFRPCIGVFRLFLLVVRPSLPPSLPRFLFL